MISEEEEHTEPTGSEHQTLAPSKEQEVQPKRMHLISLRWTITVLLILSLPPAALYAFFMFTTYDFAFFGTAAVFIVAVALIVLIIFIWTVSYKRRAAIVALALLILCIGTLSLDYAITSQSVINRDEATRVPDNLNQNIQMERYQPFTSTNIARLFEPSTLSFKEANCIPNIDSASALFPLESAIVTAVYPENASIASNITHLGHASDGTTFVPWMSYNDPYDENGNITDRPRTDWDIQYNNSSGGFYALVRGYTDIFLGTKPSTSQVEDANKEGLSFTYTPIGQEAFVFIVNSSNPIDGLTSDQVRDIYSSKITNWKEVGGPDEQIIAFQRANGSGSQSQMERFMGNALFADAPEYRKVETMSGLVGGVANYQNGKGSIGYSFRYYVTDLVGNYNVKLLAIDGVEPTLDNIENGTYPLTGDIVATTRTGESNPLVKELLDWIQGAQGQELVRKSGYAGLSSKS